MKKQTLMIECPNEKKVKQVNVTIRSASFDTSDTDHLTINICAEISKFMKDKCGSGIFAIGTGLQVAWSLAVQDRQEPVFG